LGPDGTAGCFASRRFQLCSGGFAGGNWVSSLLQLPLKKALLARLGAMKALNANEINILHAIEARQPRIYRADSRILGEGVEITGAQAILSGWACRVRQLADGRRQIIEIVLPGDVVGLCARKRPLSLTAVVALTPVRMVEAHELSTVWRDSDNFPNLSAALEIAAAEEEFYLLAQIVRLGRQTAYERIAHFFCELECRLAARDMIVAGSFPMPMTQEAIADSVGLSVVHVNRTLQQMRRERAIDLSKGRLQIFDQAAFRAAGEFVAPTVCAAA
jgi:CRP-like cAMP-binding protein